MFSIKKRLKLFNSSDCKVQVSAAFNQTKHKASSWYNLVLIEVIVGYFLGELFS